MPARLQNRTTIEAPRRGCHDISGDIEKAVASMAAKAGAKDAGTGLLHVFALHTSCSLAVGSVEHASTVFEKSLSELVPASWNRDMFEHTFEGDDDMPAHVKCCLLHPGKLLPVDLATGRLQLGEGQGVMLCEHRDVGGWGGGHDRQIVLTLL